MKMKPKEKILYIPFLFLLLCLTILPLAINDSLHAEDLKHVGSIEGMEFVLVKGGCFEMGDIFGGGNANEKPTHEICVGDYYISKYEVTQGQWNEINYNNPSSIKNCDDCPVDNVSWNGVQTFIEKLNQKTGEKYRLPTEAEWEYASRSGGEDEKWAGTNRELELEKYAWYGSNWKKGYKPVAQKASNGLGIYDMSGNVWEWCSDWYGDNYYKNSRRYNPKGPPSGIHRVFRGGCWKNGIRDIRASARHHSPSGGRYNRYIGFRLAITP